MAALTGMFLLRDQPPHPRPLPVAGGIVSEEVCESGLCGDEGEWPCACIIELIFPLIVLVGIYALSKISARMQRMVG